MMWGLGYIAGSDICTDWRLETGDRSLFPVKVLLVSVDKMLIPDIGVSGLVVITEYNVIRL